jgi:hypothetical protein
MGWYSSRLAGRLCASTTAASVPTAALASPHHSLERAQASIERIGEWMSGLWPDAAHEEVGHAQA